MTLVKYKALVQELKSRRARDIMIQNGKELAWLMQAISVWLRIILVMPLTLSKPITIDHLVLVTTKHLI